MSPEVTHIVAEVENSIHTQVSAMVMVQGLQSGGFIWAEKC